MNKKRPIPEVVVRLVDIGGTVDHHCLNSLFTSISFLNIPYKVQQI
jgi:hypothetical protein